MKPYLLFFLKIVLILALSAGLGFLACPSWWCPLLFACLPIALYFLVYKASQLARRSSLRKAKLPETHVEADGFSWVDLNKNGKLDVYEDPRESVENRVNDLLSKMSVQEKAGLMFSPQMDVVPSGKIATKGGFNFGGDVVKQIFGNKITTFACMGSLPPEEFAKWSNAVQEAARKQRLGIPVTICSDPRHVYVKNTNPLTTQKDEGMSAFPSSPGMGAANDAELMRRYGGVVREELSSVGIRFALHPCADTSTEPRWPRVYETFGDDARKNGMFAKAYIEGMQGEKIGKSSLACCIKHFPGGGPQKNGDDPHFAFGKEQVYPGGNFEEHLSSFKPSLDFGVAAVMPYYGVPKGIEGIEEVGFNFNEDVVKGLLQGKLGYQGIVHTDYSIIEGIKVFGLSCVPGRAWGIEKLNADKRLLKALEAGVDQFGGENCSKRLARLVRKGLVKEERLDQSCRKILRLKFELGLFDDPFVDPKKASSICKAKEHVALGEEAMRKSLVLLKKEGLPIRKGSKVYVEGFAPELVRKYAEVVSSPEEAEIALIRIDVPKHSDHRDPMAAMFESGSLEYSPKQRKRWEEIMKKARTVFVINLNRPAVLGGIKEKAAGILCEFNAKPEIILEALFGELSPTGVLPYSLPKSMGIFPSHPSDTPLREEESSYPRGYGLRY